MKHLRKFNENDEFIIPIDVEADVIEFRDKFLSTEKPFRTPGDEVALDKVKKKLDELVDQHPTMTDKYELFQVYNVMVTHGSPIKSMVVVRAVSATHAFVKAAIHLNSAEIVYHRLGRNKTTKWKCNPITPESIKHQIDECLLKIEKLKDIK